MSKLFPFSYLITQLPSLSRFQEQEYQTFFVFPKFPENARKFPNQINLLKINNNNIN